MKVHLINIQNVCPCFCVVTVRRSSQVSPVRQRCFYFHFFVKRYRASSASRQVFIEDERVGEVVLLAYDQCSVFSCRVWGLASV